MPKLKQVLPMFIPLLVTFYYIYPQALDVRGSSFISLSGLIGLAIYAYHRFPFREVVYVMVATFALFLIFYTSVWYNGVDDGGFSFDYVKSRIAWFFTAYIIMLLIFKIHKKPTLNTVLLYIIGAIALQSLCAFLMYISDPVKEFLTSLQMEGGEYTEEIMEEAEGQRLLGYGVLWGGSNQWYCPYLSFLSVYENETYYERVYYTGRIVCVYFLYRSVYGSYNDCRYGGGVCSYCGIVPVGQQGSEETSEKFFHSSSIPHGCRIYFCDVLLFELC